MSGQTPDDVIVDDARVLTDAAKEALEGEARNLKENTGCILQVVTTTFLSGKTVRDHANTLALSRIPNGRGMILAYDRATDSHAIAPSPSMWETYPTPALVEAFREAGAILQDKNPPLEKRLSRAAGLLMKRISEIEEQRLRHNQLLPGHEPGAVISFLVLLVFSALTFAWLFRRVKQREAADAVRYFFPQVEGAIRFGAPYGGGVIAEVRTGQNPP